MLQSIESLAQRIEPPLTIGQYRTAIELWIAMRRLAEALSVGDTTGWQGGIGATVPTICTLEIHVRWKEARA
jgi:hypothetical protein